MSDSGDGNQVDDLIGVLVATGLQGGISLGMAMDAQHFPVANTF